ncbi:hypothetical protein CONLIGDRAFT_648687 [Coniochaeta ligniaria NRRL 30616]|uniref:Uncharacterized protein n=1 Tax=Coniochaeta ligniaria NRRL 30616 TaxID=1408157 RepID=A0A1J7JAF9_9PEZI|nr:hypothetical protein CONLIGDRAFT_648687 [Coniochaeta ligniaria NRRL 30616]
MTNSSSAQGKEHPTNPESTADLDTWQSKVSELWAEEAESFLRRHHEEILRKANEDVARLRQEFQDTWVPRLRSALNNNEEKTKAVLETNKERLDPKNFSPRMFSIPSSPSSAQNGQSVQVPNLPAAMKNTHYTLADAIQLPLPDSEQSSTNDMSIVNAAAIPVRPTRQVSRPLDLKLLALTHGQLTQIETSSILASGLSYGAVKAEEEQQGLSGLRKSATPASGASTQSRPLCRVADNDQGELYDTRAFPIASSTPEAPTAPASGALETDTAGHSFTKREDGISPPKHNVRDWIICKRCQKTMPRPSFTLHWRQCKG